MNDTCIQSKLNRGCVFLSIDMGLTRTLTLINPDPNPSPRTNREHNPNRNLTLTLGVITWVSARSYTQILPNPNPTAAPTPLKCTPRLALSMGLDQGIDAGDCNWHCHAHDDEQRAAAAGMKDSCGVRWVSDGCQMGVRDEGLLRCTSSEFMLACLDTNIGQS